MASQNLPWEFHKVYPSIDVQNILGYPNYCSTEWRASCPKFSGDPTLAVTHVVNYIRYALSINVLHENVLMKIFVSSLESSQSKWLAHSCDPKSIRSSTKLVEEFLRYWGPATQDLQANIQELKDALYREGFPVDGKTTVEECEIEEEYHPPPAKEALEEHVHEESSQKDLNYEEPDETSMSIIPLDEYEIVQPRFPPAHKDEEVISPKDADVFMGDLSDMVDQHLDDFIQFWRHRWDVSFFIFYRIPIYDIEGGSCATGIELSSLENWSPHAYNSDSWQRDEDMVTDLFHRFEDDLSQHTHDDSQPSLQSRDEYPFGDSDLFYEDFEPPSCSNFDGHQVVASPEHSGAHATKRKYFHLGIFGMDL